MNLARDIQRERLYYIEFLALFSGQVSRKDLTARFGISEPAATKDLSIYASIAPTVLRYDLRRKCYVFDGGQPYFEHNVEQALHALAGDGAITYDSSKSKRIPGWISTSIKRQVPLEIAATLTRAIDQHQVVKATYSSLSKGTRPRELSPLALVHDGLRWHIRCFDHEEGEFKDFSLTRFSQVHSCGESSVDLSSDREWNNEIVLKLVPHPKARHPETTLTDYDMKGGEKTITLRSCLVGYFLRRWHVDFSDNASGNPLAQQLYLANKNEVLEAGVPGWALDLGSDG